VKIKIRRKNKYEMKRRAEMVKGNGNELVATKGLLETDLNRIPVLRLKENASIDLAIGDQKRCTKEKEMISKKANMMTEETKWSTVTDRQMAVDE
jgi:hypothetical protein